MCPRRFGYPLFLIVTFIVRFEVGWIENKSGDSSSGSSIVIVVVAEKV